MTCIPIVSNRMYWRLIIEGEPVAKMAPHSRLVKTKGGKEFVTHYTPKKNRQYETAVRDGAAVAWAKAPLVDVQITLLATFYRVVPDSFSKIKRQLALDDVIRPTTKPDYDNLLKSLCDGIKGVVFHDDNLIVEATAIKRYALRPYTDVAIAWTPNV